MARQNLREEIDFPIFFFLNTVLTEKSDSDFKTMKRRAKAHTTQFLKVVSLCLCVYALVHFNKKCMSGLLLCLSMEG